MYIQSPVVLLPSENFIYGHITMLKITSPEIA